MESSLRLLLVFWCFFFFFEGGGSKENISLKWVKNLPFLNPFYVNLRFLYSLKTSENQKFFDVLRWYRSETLAWNGLIFGKTDFNSTDERVPRKSNCMEKNLPNSQENTHGGVLFHVNVLMHQFFKNVQINWFWNIF